MPAPRSPAPQPSSPLRRAVEVRSAGPLMALTRVPRWVPAIVLAVLLVTGLAFGGRTGAACLGLVAVVLLWLTFLSWPLLSSPARALRAATLLLLVAAAVDAVS